MPQLATHGLPTRGLAIHRLTGNFGYFMQYYINEFCALQRWIELEEPLVGDVEDYDNRQHLPKFSSRQKYSLEAPQQPFLRPTTDPQEIVNPPLARC